MSKRAMRIPAPPSRRQAAGPSAPSALRSASAVAFPLHALRHLPGVPTVQRQGATTCPSRRRFPDASGVDPAGGGATAFEEIIETAPTRTGDVIEGGVAGRLDIAKPGASDPHPHWLRFGLTVGGSF